MRIENKTNWSTKDLKHLASFCLGRFSYSRISKWQRKRLVIKVIPARIYRGLDFEHYKETGEKRRIVRGHSGYRGIAYLNGTYTRVTLPNPGIVDKINMRKFGYVLMHELQHIAGRDHRDMGKNIWNSWPSEEQWEDPRITAFDHFEIEPKKPKLAKPKPDIRIVRYERAMMNLKRNESKLKRYQGLVKKWKSKIRYYEKTLVAAGKIPADKQ